MIKANAKALQPNANQLNRGCRMGHMKIALKCIYVYANQIKKIR